MQEPPMGAIYNGKENLRRLVEHYKFESGGLPLPSCGNFQELVDCFNVMAEWIEDESNGWEPSEAQQGLIPIPERYAEQ